MRRRRSGDGDDRRAARLIGLALQDSSWVCDRGRPIDAARPHPGSAYLVTLGLTLANPATILAFGAVFTVLGLRAGGGALQPVLLVAGVLVGSATWWIVLASVVAALRARLTPVVVRGIGAASAAALLAFGVLAVSRAV